MVQILIGQVHLMEVFTLHFLHPRNPVHSSLLRSTSVSRARRPTHMGRIWGRFLKGKFRGVQIFGKKMRQRSWFAWNRATLFRNIVGKNDGRFIAETAFTLFDVLFVR